MATNVKAILSQIKVNDELKDLWFRAANIEVTLGNGTKTDLATVLTGISSDIDALPTVSEVEQQIANAGLTKMEIVSEIPSPEEANDTTIYLYMNEGTGYYDMYKKVEEKGVSKVVRLDDTSIDLTNYLQKFEGASEDNKDEIVTVTADGGIKMSGKKVGGAALAGTPNANTVATEAAVKAAVDGVHSVHIGESAPSTMKNGDLFIQLVEETAE